MYQIVARVLFVVWAAWWSMWLTDAQAQDAPASAAAPTVETETEKVYLQINHDDQGRPKALETAIARFAGKPGTPYEGCTIDLVGVIHIGEKEYYKDLKQRLAGYDAVLYELVAPDGTRIRPEDLKNRVSILASMQNGMKDMLGLEYQLAEIDYMATNFVHADMSPEEFQKDMASRGDGLMNLFARMIGASIATQSAGGGDVGVLMALSSDNQSVELKRLMAKQLVQVDAMTAAMDDGTGDNTLIKGRNRKALEVLRRELDAGKKKIAVFYGAGHLDDMAERLMKDFSLVDQGNLVWLKAWDLKEQ